MIPSYHPTGKPKVSHLGVLLTALLLCKMKVTSTVQVVGTETYKHLDYDPNKNNTQ